MRYRVGEKSKNVLEKVELPGVKIEDKSGIEYRILYKFTVYNCNLHL